MTYQYLSDFFFNWPTSPKPPIEGHIIKNKKPIYKQGSPDPVSFSYSAPVGYCIQMALAGFSEADIEIWYEGTILHIKGDNTYRDDSEVISKFKSRFHHKISCINDLDLENSDIALINGILRIGIPLKEKEPNKKYLYGKEKD